MRSSSWTSQTKTWKSSCKLENRYWDHISIVVSTLPTRSTLLLYVLHKLFNKNNTKVSYGRMENMAQVIKRHNNKILNQDQMTNEKQCNCRRKNECPLKRSCLKKNLVYQATVTSNNQNAKKVYIGMTEGEFKTRFNNHTMSFKHKKHSTSTAFSKYIWELKEKNENYNIEWSILKHAKSYTSGNKSCNLCTTEKLFILNADKRFLLNKRSELVSKCRHSSKFLYK